MDKTPSIRQQRKQINYNLVLDTAIKLFNERGYEQTTMGDISSETGISNGSLYHMFGSKDEILKQIYNRNINISLGLTSHMEEKAADPYQYLYKFMIDTQELWRKAGPMLLLNKYRWVTSRTMMGCSPIQREELLAFISYAQKIGTISSKSDPAETVEFIFTLHRGILYGWTSRDDFDMEKYSKIFWPPVIRGIIKGTLIIDGAEELEDEARLAEPAAAI